MKKYYQNTVLFLLSLPFLLAGCTNKPAQKVAFGGNIQGTYYKVVYYDSAGRDFRRQIDSLLHGFDKTASLWVENSLINRVNAGDTSAVLNDDFIRLFQLSKKIYHQTRGAFNPAIGALVNVWGFGPERKGEVDTALIDSLLVLSRFDEVTIDKKRKKIFIPAGLKFDFNAVAQGYSVDLVGNYLHGRGVDNFLIDIGGELLAKGRKPDGNPWRVGVESPVENAGYGDRLQTIVTLSDKAIATSGSYRKFYVQDGKKYSHTIDPRTGFPVRHNLLSASVVAEDCATADALATALMVMGKEKAIAFSRRHPAFGIYLITAGKNGFDTYANPVFDSLIVNGD